MVWDTPSQPSATVGSRAHCWRFPELYADLVHCVIHYDDEDLSGLACLADRAAAKATKPPRARCGTQVLGIDCGDSWRASAFNIASTLSLFFFSLSLSLSLSRQGNATHELGAGGRVSFQSVVVSSSRSLDDDRFRVVVFHARRPSWKLRRPYHRSSGIRSGARTMNVSYVVVILVEPAIRDKHLKGGISLVFLKQLLDEMSADLALSQKAEAERKADHAALSVAQAKEVANST